MEDGSFFAGMLLAGLITASVWTWLQWVLLRGDFWGEPLDPPVPDASLTPTECTLTASPRSWPPLAIITAFTWITFVVVSRIIVEIYGAVKAPQEATVWLSLIVSVAILFSLLMLLFASGRLKPAEVGITASEWQLQLEWGQRAFLAAFGPTFVLIFATLAFRSADQQHEFLQLLRDGIDPLLLIGLVLTAAVVAPLMEELLFRVILQGWLTDQCGLRVALPVASMLFAFMHGWRDGIALLPLSFLLGLLYASRQRYLAVVAAHGLFNSANLVLAMLSLGDVPPS